MAVPSGAASITIREAQASDISRICTIEAEAFHSDRLSRRSLAAFARSPSACLLVACGDSGILGYAVVLFRRGARSARLYSLAVAARAAGAGLGKRLLAAAEQAARRRGADRLTLEVRTDNAAAIRLYDRAGYALLGRRENYYGDGTPALRYSADLRTSSRLCLPAFGRAA